MEMRAIIDADKDLLAKWIGRDPHHAGYTPEMFLADAADRVMFCDELGPVIATRFTPAIRLGVQFDPHQRNRNAQLLGPAFALVVRKAQEEKISEIVFESSSQHLIEFCVKRLGFLRSPNELVFRLAALQRDGV